MEKLIATRQIVYGGFYYYAGEELPSDSPLKSEWISAGSAKVVSDETNETAVEKKPKAKKASVETGIEGVNVVNAESTPTIVGKVPKTAQRKQPKKRKSTPKKKISGE